MYIKSIFREMKTSKKIAFISLFTIFIDHQKVQTDLSQFDIIGHRTVLFSNDDIVLLTTN